MLLSTMLLFVPSLKAVVTFNDAVNRLFTTNVTFNDDVVSLFPNRDHLLCKIQARNGK